MKWKRERTSELIRQHLSFLIKENVSDKFDIIEINDVQLSQDLKNATIYLSCLNKEKEVAYLNKLNDFKFEFQRIIGKRLKLRYTPKLKFCFDKAGEENILKVEKLLRKIKNES